MGVIKYYILNIAFLGIAKNSSLQMFGVKATNLLQDKILIDSRDFSRLGNKNKREHNDKFRFLTRKSALLKALYWKPLG